MRNLTAVIRQMMACIPETEKELISEFKWLEEDSYYKAPESPIGWQRVSEQLQMMDINSTSPRWMVEMCSIFSTYPVDSIYEMMRNEELKK